MVGHCGLEPQTSVLSGLKPNGLLSTTFNAKSLDLWQSELEFRGLSKLTIASYRQKVEALLDKYETPNEVDVRTFLTERLSVATTQEQKDKIKGTLANYVKAFRSFFDYLFDNKLCNSNPTLRLKQPGGKYQERRVPKDEEVDKLMRALDDVEDASALLLFVDCGVRVHELATIKLDRIDFNDASILINGKGSKVRTVYLSETTLKYLRVYVQTIKSEYLFPSTRADARSAYRNRTFFEHRLRKLCDKAGIERLSPHQLRHYFATHTLSHGADVKAVSEMLGHADVTITLKIYHHVNAKAIRAMHREYSPIANTSLALPEAISS